ncbi:protein FAR-RED IMPAIRED RESPONSE 1-like [Castanea sativa]|uniref:protein FAR-RED IMPAIRED RESPONSE 1-like n=1 Tax=Castanea sativa TaxID=21020 RepID=UPI003F65133C
MEEEKTIGSSRVELNENNIENATEETRNVKEKIEDPKVGMMFNSIDDIMKYYTRYGKEKGFAVAKRSSKKGDDGEVRYVTIACNRAGKPRNRSSNPLKLQSESKTDCKAQLRAVLCPDGKWILNAMVLDHNHGLSPSRTRYYKCNRLLEPHAKKRFASNDKADIRVKKNLKSIVVEAGGHGNLSFIEKDCRNKLSCLHLGEGDVAAMQDFFLKMQVDNSDFFYTMDFNENGRLRNVFWADARSRATFKEFGDVVMFDTTYLVNKYDIPFAHFVGVNHHGQSTLLGCGLISNEDTETFTWLFQTWLKCMFGCPPCAIVTDHDKAMKKAIEIVFPKARHRWCLSHIMEKLSKKLRGYKEYESIKICMQNAVYDSLTKEEFEESWGKFVEKYKLESNEWLLGLYDERHRWVPAFVKDMFWAGMSTTKQGESMHAFFDGYINLKTTLKQFLDQYEPAIAQKVVNENNEDFNSFNLCIPCITHYEMEKQCQSAYTIAKFKEFQRELIGNICCNLFSCKKGTVFSEYELREDVSLGESHRPAIFRVYVNEDTNEVNCNCQLFEFRGILCRHQIMVFIHREVYRIPDKYILKRWSKTVIRSHNKVRISYDNWFVKPEAQRYDKMCKAFYEVANLAADSEDRCEKVMAQIQELKREFENEEGVCGRNKPI